MAEINTANLLEKWAPVLDAENAPKITSAYKREVTAVLLENQEQDMIRQASGNAGFLNEDTFANNGGSGLALGAAGANTGNVAGYDPVMISLVRRAAPLSIGYDLCGVQPMTQPTGLIFAMKSRYGNKGAEALFNEADTDFSGKGTAEATRTGSGVHAGLSPFDTPYTYGTGMATANAENLGGTGANSAVFNEMSFTIERTQVTAQTRALKAEYTVELAQDLQKVHNLSAESELSKILTTEIAAEMNREIIRNIYVSAEVGAQSGVAVAGTFDLDVDANGRWHVEKWKGLMFQIEREANIINQRTRRGKGNFVLCSSDVASALMLAGILDYNPALQSNLNVDESATTFAGVLKNGMKVYVDPYASNYGANQFVLVGYKGVSAWDAGMYYCPYIPLQMYRTQDPQTFQPKIAYKTRYGLVANPFTSLDGTGNGLAAGQNYYFRKLRINNLL